MSETFTLAGFDDSPERLAVNLNAPLPLGYAEAVRRGLQLRAKGGNWTYPVIATVMAEYHGFRRSPGWWKNELRARGCTPRPRGVQIQDQVRAA